MSEEDGKIFSLTEAERLRAQLEPVLIEAMETHRKLAGFDEELAALAEKIQRSGGLQVPYERVAKQRIERNRLHEAVEEALEKIQSTGCVVKDLEVGLLDFPSRIDNQDVYLCWKLGEDRIRFYHRQDEGFSGRKPIDPRDTNYQPPIQ